MLPHNKTKQSNSSRGVTIGPVTCKESPLILYIDTFDESVCPSLLFFCSALLVSAPHSVAPVNLVVKTAEFVTTTTKSVPR